jgi:hypothetical protein
MDVVKAMTPEMHACPTKEDAAKAKAEAIAEALGELVGKRLDRPTAHSIGKLFQKRLVGRPAWIGDGQAVATLKKSTGHNANTYRIDVSASGRDLTANSSPNTLSFADACQRHFPHSPHSPRRDPGDGEMGNEGKGGKDIPVNEVVSSDFKRAKAGWSGRL